MSRKFRTPNINKVEIVGNLTADPLLNTTNVNKVPVVNFRIASGRKFKTTTGKINEEVCYVNVTAWKNLANIVKKRLTKGDTVYVEGRLQSRNWIGTAGENKSTVEILAEKIQFLSKKDENDEVLEEENEEE